MFIKTLSRPTAKICFLALGILSQASNPASAGCTGASAPAIAQPVVAQSIVIGTTTHVTHHSTVVHSAPMAAPSHVVHEVQNPLLQGLPPGAKIISQRVVPAKSATPPVEKEKAVATKTDEKKKPAEPNKEPEVEVREEYVPDLQTNEEIEVDVMFAGSETGTAVMVAGEFENELAVSGWSQRTISLTMPNLGILKPMNVSILLYRPDGFLVRKFDARLIRKDTIRRVERMTMVSNTKPE
ncbi:MAG: hypothetical protein WBD20_10570 [Pirellulaceae bacterium]